MKSQNRRNSELKAVPPKKGAPVHYAMPINNMVYDALQYGEQVEKAIASHKMSGAYEGVASDEYLSGFMREIGYCQS